MTGSTQPPKPFVHSLGDTCWVLLRANPAPGNTGQETYPLFLGSTPSTCHHWQVKQGVVQPQWDRRQALCSTVGSRG